MMFLVRSAAVLLVGVSLAFSVGVAPASAQGTDRSETYRQLDLFGEVFERIRADYVEEVTDEELIKAAIQGMLSSLDPFSSYIPAEAFQDLQRQTRGEFGGLGIEVTMENGLVRVVSPIDETPAYRAGIQAGDLITHLDGEAVLGMTLNEAVEIMRGAPGSDIVISILRGDQETFDVTITRDVIRVQSVRARLERDVGYIRITAFTDQTTPGLRDAFADLFEQGGDTLAGFVIDLRNNPGGLLDQGIAVADLLLERGEIVSTRGRDDANVRRYNAEPGDLARGLPLVVLVNRGSASASEIVAGALQDHQRAIIMGEATFGKAAVQSVIPMRDRGAMRLTTARYYTPAGRLIENDGIAPDFVVPTARIEVLPQPSRRAPTLPGLPMAEEDEAPEAETAEEAAVETEDYQLARALDLLRGLAFMNARALQ